MDAKQLKDSILRYAMQGKLVPQEPEDEPASELVKRMKAEKELLIAQKVIKNEKVLPDITEEEIPFEIPATWEWVRLGEIGSWGAGSTPSRGNIEYYGGNIPWLKTGELNDGIVTESKEYITEKALKETSVKLNPIGSVLIAMYGATIGKLGILNIEATTNQACCACVPFNGITKEYLFYALLFNRRTFINSAEGGAQPNISRTKLINFVIPLPPFNEQIRIAEKIKQLFDKCSNYNDKYLILKNINKEFPLKLEKSILLYAIQGKLVEQNPAEEPASQLIGRIKLEKERLIKEKVIKKEKALPEITENEILFKIPETWEWVRLGNIAYSIDAGKSPQCESRQALLNEWGVIKTTAIQNNVFEADKNKVLPEEFEIKPSYIIEEGNVLITRAGPKNRVGIACYVEKINQRLILSDKTLKINIGNEYIDYMYLSFVLNSPEIRKSTESKMSGMANSQVNISQTNLKLICIPVPPIAEQKRIVESINKYRDMTVKL